MGYANFLQSRMIHVSVKEKAGQTRPASKILGNPNSAVLYRCAAGDALVAGGPPETWTQTWT